MGFCFYSLSIKKNDVLVEEYTAADYDAGTEYEVDFIVAERTKGKKTEYLVKWKVFQCSHHCTPLVLPATGLALDQCDPAVNPSNH